MTKTTVSDTKVQISLARYTQMQQAFTFITLFAVAVHLGNPATSDTVRYEIVCHTDQENPQIQHLANSELSLDIGAFRMWYSVGLETFRPMEILINSDGQQLLRGQAFDFRGRQTHLEYKQNGELTYDFFVLAAEWNCSFLDNYQTGGGQ